VRALNDAGGRGEIGDRRHAGGRRSTFVVGALWERFRRR
jgi:hypothetical protein